MRYVPTLTDPDTQDYGPARDYTDPAEGNTGACQTCREPGMELDSDGLCEVCTQRRAEWIRDRTGESSESAVYVDNIPF